MAGSSVTITYDDGQDGATMSHRGRIRKVIADWVSDDSAGTAAGTTRKIVGELIKVVTDPGTAAPTDNWDVIITDEEGVDVCAACMNSAALIARDTSNTEQTYLYLQESSGTPIGISAFPVVCDKLTISIANAGNSKTGQVILYYRV